MPLPRFLHELLRRRGRKVRGVLAREEATAALSDEALRRASLALRYRAQCGSSLNELLVEAFALVREAAWRTLKMRHYPAQLLGGVAMHGGAIAEMQTGEGKTLTATLPLYLAALEGFGAHLATANDYLAARDAATMRPLFELLGLSVGVVQASSSRPERWQAYRADITYGTAKEFGFDFLRDRLLDRRVSSGVDRLGRMLAGETHDAQSGPVQRPPHFILADEADSLLIDEARTPLIISALPGGQSRDVAAALYRWSAKIVDQFAFADDFDFDDKRREITLTASGRRKVRDLEKPGELAEVDLLEMYDHVERAILVTHEFHRDRQYVTRDGEIVIVDESTGRLAEGRKWRDGLHQAIEAKEGLEPSVRTDEAARISVQDFFLRYRRRAGMSGTAATSRGELRRIYELDVVSIATHRPCQRRGWPTLVFATRAAKWQAVIAETAELYASGRPVLIGTRSIAASEELAPLLGRAGLPHQVLNAHQSAAEAEVIARAGQRAQITVATNMAGRGTDIALADEVAALGGLHVIATEFHESPRIDRQLIGRCARQGDPGTFRQFASLDDEVLRIGFGHSRANQIKQLGQAVGDAPLSASFVRYFRRAQQRLERHHYRQRRLLLFHERQRRESQQRMGQDPHLDSPG